MSITFVNLFEVPAAEDDTFLHRWQRVNSYMRAKDGYVDHTLHRSLDAGARYRYVNVATWESAAACRAAHDDGFRELVSTPDWAAVTSHPGMYELVHSGRAEATS